MKNNTVQFLFPLFDADHRWAAHELEAGLSMLQNCVPHSARHSAVPQTCSAFETHEFYEVQRRHRYEVAQELLDGDQKEDEDFLG